MLLIDHTKGLAGLSTFCNVFCGLRRYITSPVLRRLAILIMVLIPLGAGASDARAGSGAAVGV